MYQAAENRYDSMEYKCSGRSGVLLPRISLGLWQNLGPEKNLEEQEAILSGVFDTGIIHFDLASNYGFPAVGRAEGNFGSALRDGLGRHRDELFISTEAGFDFWPGPYGNWGLGKYPMASLDSSLKCMGLEYVDVFYHHRPDPGTPLEETMGALLDIVRQRETLYVRIPNYQAEEAEAAIHILRGNKTPCLPYQPRYNMLERWVEGGLLELLDCEGVDYICHSPLAQGILTGRYLDGIPGGSRASKKGSTTGGRYLIEGELVKIRALDRITGECGQSPTRMALAQVLRRKEVISVLIGASNVAQLEGSVKALDSLAFGREELAEIEGTPKG